MFLGNFFADFFIPTYDVSMLKKALGEKMIFSPGADLSHPCGNCLPHRSTLGMRDWLLCIWGSSRVFIDYISMP